MLDVLTFIFGCGGGGVDDEPESPSLLQLTKLKTIIDKKPN